MSNVADHPSRFERAAMLSLDPEAVEVKKPSLPAWWHVGRPPLA